MDEENIVDSFLNHGYIIISVSEDSPRMITYTVKRLVDDQHFEIVNIYDNIIIENRINHIKEHTNAYCAKIVESWKQGSLHFIVIEYCYNGTFKNLLCNGIPIDKLQFPVWGKQVLEGLQSLHKKRIAHMNLKPSSILFDEYYNAKLTNYGFSKKTPGELWNEGDTDMKIFYKIEGKNIEKKTFFPTQKIIEFFL